MEAAVASDANPITESPKTGSAESLFRTEQPARFEEFVKRCQRPQWAFDADLLWITKTGRSSIRAEQFERFCKRLDKLRQSRALRTMQITSLVKSEGKTSLAANLALTASQRHRRVLLIDGDLRTPMLYQRIGAPASPGFSEYLLGEVDEKEVVQYGAEGNLCFIPSGKKVGDPEALLSNERLVKLFDQMAVVFDLILVDSPPCLSLPDAAIISGLCDGVLMVVKDVPVDQLELFCRSKG
jgi:capsular exopolysaccharide synthesis family protein